MYESRFVSSWCECAASLVWSDDRELGADVLEVPLLGCEVERARGVCGGVAFLRDAGATPLVSFTASRQLESADIEDCM